ncbi:MAG: heme utilization protein HutZ [Neptuniibacter caesariensis]|uniref:Heme utilization protein HutZ n=1 Tax=Neptuniibacter caesariensis TaxID=207954 RepID=A0A2G6JPA9_NEPCE|nr:MAG: heme utilization protein HutZ [Neptuniibacter caesariensis]
MSNEKLQAKTQAEILEFIQSRKSLQLATMGTDGEPYASYAPFALGDDCIYVLLSDIAVHAVNLKEHPKASVLIIQDEDCADELFARVRVNYAMDADLIEFEADGWQQGIDALVERHGERINHLSKMVDFKLFKLKPTGGRYVKGFARAFTLVGNGLGGEEIAHMRDGHKERSED